ncbi:Fic protein family [Streptococcus pneumoniae]|nr:Fic protein family [Streptococcus pneumoniae]
MQSTYNIDNPNLSYEAKHDLWRIGFGLQKVDNLVPSAYMESLAEKQSRGELTYEQVYENATAYLPILLMQVRKRQTWFLYVL